MMRVTFDTNVLVSAFIAKHGRPASLMQLAMTLDTIELILSNPILTEFEDVLMREEVRRRFSYTQQDVKSIVEALKKSARIIPLKSSFRVVKEDSKDNMILNTSYDGNADYIVSGDSHLLRLRRFKGTKIVNPTQMMMIMSRKFPEFVFHL